MRRGEDCRGTLFFQLFPPTRLDVSQPPVGIRCTLLTIKGAHRFTRASVITRFSFQTIELHQSLPAKIAIFIAMCFLLSRLYSRLLLSHLLPRYDPDKCNFLFTNLRSALDSKFSSCLASTYLFISRLQSSRAASHLAASFLA